MASQPASPMCRGVSKSGSPAPRPITSLPSAFRRAARAVTASVGEGLTRWTRRETGRLTGFLKKGAFDARSEGGTDRFGYITGSGPAHQPRGLGLQPWDLAAWGRRSPQPWVAASVRAGARRIRLEQMRFTLAAGYEPSGDQPEAIAKLVDGLGSGLAHQTLLGVTGSGKTHTIARVIECVQRPTLVLAHNKTLAAQLYGEFREFFPANAVEYFVSYYDYYQPEAYVPSTDTYIEKDASINEHIEQMRLSATKALLERPDSIIVGTVSAIYGLGDPDDYLSLRLILSVGEKIDPRKLIRQLTELQYTRNEMELHRGTYRVRGEIVDVFPAENETEALRIECFDGEIEKLSLFDPLTGATLRKVQRYTVYPRTHYASTRESVLNAIETIKEELKERLEVLRNENKLLEAQRLEQRTRYDIEMMAEVGYCQGIENYSRHLTRRAPGEPPPTLFDYLPPDALLVVDESHVTIPQLGAMYKGDRSRKETLVEFGFRLPSALDNRPLKFEEWERREPRTIFVSATPGPYELRQSGGSVVELVVRPTGLVDPEVEVRPARTQVDDVLGEI